MARSGRRSGTAGGGGADTRARIVEAALASLHEEGVLGASARAIARRGGFNQALIFYHFGSVNDMLLAAVDELSERRCRRYTERLDAVSSLRELVAVAGQLHAEDLADGHITVLTQMLAASVSDPALRGPMAERFAPWVAIVERAITRVVAGTPYAALVPVRDLALAVTGEFIGLELLLNLHGDGDGDGEGGDGEGGRGAQVFATFELLAGLLEAVLAGTTPA